MAREGPRARALDRKPCGAEFAATGAYRLGLLGDALQRIAAVARLGAAEAFQQSFAACEALRRQPAGLQLLLSQAELRQSGRLQSNVPESGMLDVSYSCITRNYIRQSY